MAGLWHHPRVRVRTCCCTACFSHSWLLDHIRTNSTNTGQCDYCGSRRRRLIQVTKLADFFHNLMSMYESPEGGHGDSLIATVQDEWNIFSDPLHESDRSGELLEDILNSEWVDGDGESPVNAYELVRSRDVLQDLNTWEEFCIDVREDPNMDPAFGEVFEEDLKNTTGVLPVGTTLYRARLGWGSEVNGRRQAYNGPDIGAPPPAKAESRRANRQGKSVLYCAEDEQTAVAEVRPALGHWVSTCQLRLRDETTILDLVDGIPVPNPFTNESLAWYVQFTELLASFAEALSTTLARDDDINDYVPSQKICEYLERLGYGGIKYSSAMLRDGKNLVFFNPNAAEILESRLVEVTTIKIGFHPR